MGKVMPKDVDWIKDYCVEIDPKSCNIRLAGAAGSIKYDYLVVAAGINIDWDKIEGLTEALKTPGVCSNYSARTVNKTFEAIRNFKDGNAIFTFPNTPIKCAGAPQKIMYLTDAHLRQVCFAALCTFLFFLLFFIRTENERLLHFCTTLRCRLYLECLTTQRH